MGGPDAVPRLSQTGGPLAPGTYRLTFAGTTPDGKADAEGRWHWIVNAVDDLGRQSSADQPFWLNNTLGALQVPPAVAVRAGRRVRVATFTLSRPAKVTTTIESANGVGIRTVGKGNVGAGTVSVRWDGRDRHKNLVYGGRYLVRVRAQNQYGPVELTQPFTVYRR